MVCAYIWRILIQNKHILPLKQYGFPPTKVKLKKKLLFSFTICFLEKSAQKIKNKATSFNERFHFYTK